MIEEMKQWLEALENSSNIVFVDPSKGPMRSVAITSLRQAIEQAEKQEPFGWVSQHTVKGPYEWQFNKELSGVYGDNAISILPVYNTPQPQREWVDMPELELLGAYEEEQQGRWGDHVRGLLNVQAKLKERNHVN